MRKGTVLTVAAILSATLGLAYGPVAPRGATAPGFVKGDRNARLVRSLPVSFEPNVGQTDGRVRFVARAPGSTLFLTSKTAVMALRPSPPSATRPRGQGGRSARPNAEATDVLEMEFLGGTASAVDAGNHLSGVSNYFLGSNPASWRTGVPHYGTVTYRSLYPGVDLTFEGIAGGIEYHFTVAPAADPSSIRLRFSGQGSMRTNADGDLVLGLEDGTRVVESRPRIYQELPGRAVRVDGGYALRGGDEVGFSVGPYDRSKTLVIDPEIAYSTYLGGSDFDLGQAIAVDQAGHAFVAGPTASLDFPTTPGSFQPSPPGGGDTFVAKLTRDGSGLVYSTYLGGTSEDDPFGMTVDRFGNAYVAGFTFSQDFPTTSGAFQPTAPGGIDDAWVTKLDPKGAKLVWSTYLGGSGHEAADQVAVDRAGDAYVLLDTGSTDFPVTPGSFQTTFAGGDCTILCDFGPFDAAVVKLAPDGSRPIYSTYLGGSGDDAGLGFAIDRQGDAYLAVETTSSDYPVTSGAYQTSFAGGDGLFGVSADNGISKLNPTGSALVYSTYLGTSGDECIFFVCGLAVDRSGHAYVASNTDSAEFPTTPGAFQPSSGGDVDATITKFKRDGSGLVYSTYLGGSAYEEPLYNAAVDGQGHVYVSGDTSSSDFPTVDAFQPALDGPIDTMVVEVGRDGSSLVFSSYWGGSGVDGGFDIAVDASHDVFVTGYTDSSDLQTTSDAFQPTFAGVSDGFLTKIEHEETAGPLAVHRGPASGRPSRSVWSPLWRGRRRALR